jgi:hypothetical protein
MRNFEILSDKLNVHKSVAYLSDDQFLSVNMGGNRSNHLAKKDNIFLTIYIFYKPLKCMDHNYRNILYTCVGWKDDRKNL